MTIPDDTTAKLSRMVFGCLLVGVLCLPAVGEELTPRQLCNLGCYLECAGPEGDLDIQCVQQCRARDNCDNLPNGIQEGPDTHPFTADSWHQPECGEGSRAKLDRLCGQNGGNPHNAVLGTCRIGPGSIEVIKNRSACECYGGGIAVTTCVFQQVAVASL